MEPARTTNRTRASTTADTASHLLVPGKQEVVVRMYGQGLGDCFLLAFPRKAPASNGRRRVSGRPVYVLIDCGVIAGTPDGPARMRSIVADIRRSTADPDLKYSDGAPMGHLDLLVITHEHWDHLSGFVQAQDEWKSIQVDALWTAWTEKDEPNGLPDVLKNILKRQQQALAYAADQALTYGMNDGFAATIGLMAFYSDAADDGLAFAAAPGVGDAFAAAKAKVGPDDITCCEPGDVLPVPGTDALAYVLGPPRSDEYLRRTNPSKRGRETYEHGDSEKSSEPDGEAALRRVAEARSGFNAFVMPLLGPHLPAAQSSGLPAADGGPNDWDLYERSFPFGRSVRVPLPSAEVNAPSHPALASYFDPVNHWRRIDHDWLSGAEAFALQANNLTNNTSLVLAFELPPGTPGDEGKVLLFVGDAQVGNWLSWDAITKWNPKSGVTISELKKAQDNSIESRIDNLLRRAVFYKVGHHGSHNATMKAKGVERMIGTGPLLAFVPASAAVARDIKGWCHMPLDAILDAIAARKNGYVVFPDGNSWPLVARANLARKQKDIGLNVSSDRLSPKVRRSREAPIEDEVPLWVQAKIPY